MDACWDWTGARWWKFDFHTHTPASIDYGKGPDQEELRKITPKEWLLNYMKAGIDCVAITDHNSGAWIDYLKQALSELEDEKPSEYRPLFLFPGVELSVNGNIHILAIFPLEKKTSDIDSLLGAVKFRGTKGTSDQCSECSVLNVIDEIHEAGGLAIPAHVDQARGLFETFSGTTLEQVLNHDEIVAIEIKDPSYSKPPMYVDKKTNWAEVLGTDSHHPTGGSGLSFPGSHFTWIKMSQPSFDGLKLALIDGNLSLKRSDECTDDPNAHGFLAIEGININKAKYLGRGEPFDCQFNPWLNTIIGGRGTGKSTVIEFLRIALNRKEELPDSLKSDFSKYSKISQNRHDDGLLIDESIFTVFYRKDGSRFRITWSSSDKSHVIEEETSPNVWTPSEGDIKQRFPARMYSQKQIFEISKRPDSLLQIIDDSSEVGYREWEQEQEELVSKYLSIRAQQREVQAGLQEETVILGELDDVKRKLDVFEKSGHTDILKAYQLRQNQNKAIENWEKSWSNTSEDVKTLAEKMLPPEIDIQYFSTECDENRELLEAISQFRVKFHDFQKEIITIATQINHSQQSWIDSKDTLKIKEAIHSATDKYTQLLEQLSEIDADGPSDYGKFVKQRQGLEGKLESFREKRELLKEYTNKAAEYLSKIYKHRSKITKLREEFLEDILENNTYVQISIIPYANKNTVEGQLRKLIERDGGGFDKDIGSLDKDKGNDEGLLSLLYCDNGKTIEEKIEDLKTFLFLIHSGDNEAIKKTFDKRFVTHIQGLTPECIDRLRCWFPEDSLNIQYSSKDKENFKSIEQGSPGQKTAALLAFILTYGNEPLILDQPEDDLDNHLIYDLIVSQLREIKQHRQIIIVTHNANLVVNGDAENVIALDVPTGQTHIIAQDCLQDISIRDEICRVMEGGKEAFDQRYKRINAGK